MTPQPATLDELRVHRKDWRSWRAAGFTSCWSRDGNLAGIVTERDLFGLQRVTMRNVTQTIRLARDVAALQRIVQDIAALTDNLVAQGAAAEPLTHTITALNDALTQRLFELLLPQFELDDLEWCWLAVGSEGRREQTVATDQDNAIVFECGERDVAVMRERLLRFARGPTSDWPSWASRSAPGTSWRAIPIAA